ncbi:hypothetical protein SPRG_08023 [Saprolegnia parasitica CBS 223.65]|uniref:Uncharacterized protein n=1 Tax=Saprolegnia parasitica (strain CBS 223.65) TaxID=695850 RepID=A0A067C780_SAPPC|nr:hypothetical protein SPRG_08023 [Saprolegnia parasitica CBS 223.65]KDO26619.1 hypothetical protein SPRG_08023 [Saprolegnia parasitica CBS 223.65]|eukprot:XP_012202760.1 hypothetical protein SPRG_08023 [Saprolegnia parasitica CBS 223.65]
MDELPTSFQSTKKPLYVPKTKAKPKDSGYERRNVGQANQRNKRPRHQQASSATSHYRPQPAQASAPTSAFGRSFFKESFLEDPWRELLEGRPARETPPRAASGSAGFGRSLFLPSFLEDPWAPLLSHA